MRKFMAVNWKESVSCLESAGLVVDYLDKDHSILDALLEVERIVEELELHDGFIGQPTAINFLHSVNDTKRLHRVLCFAISLNSTRCQMSFPSPHVHHVVTDLWVDGGDEIAVLNVDI
jgi:hypothetical protein